MSGIHDRIRRDENALQRLMQDIPGFDGYREREIRRTADKLLRERLVADLDVVRDALKGVTRVWARGGKLELLDDIDRLSRLMGKVRDNIRFADYGYTGFFDAVKIREAELDQMYAYDLSLKDNIAACAEAVEGLSAYDGDEPMGALGTVEEAIGELQRMVDSREQVASAAVDEGS